MKLCTKMSVIIRPREEKLKMGFGALNFTFLLILNYKRGFCFYFYCPSLGLVPRETETMFDNNARKILARDCNYVS